MSITMGQVQVLEILVSSDATYTYMVKVGENRHKKNFDQENVNDCIDQKLVNRVGDELSITPLGTKMLVKYLLSERDYFEDRLTQIEKQLATISQKLGVSELPIDK